MIAIAANCAAFVLEVPMQDAYAAHEIAPVMALGAALAGRTLGSRIYGRRAPASRHRRTTRYRAAPRQRRTPR